MLARFCGNSSVVFTLGHLASGDPDVMKPRGAARFLTIKEIVGHLKLLEDQGLTHVSRKGKGWETLEHPILRNVQWKRNEELQWDESRRRTIEIHHFYIRINGRMVIQSLPLISVPTDPNSNAPTQRITCASWTAGFKHGRDISTIEAVCRALGTLESGSMSAGFADPIQFQRILLDHNLIANSPLPLITKFLMGR